ncbi:MAG: hypothetical protein QXK35_04250 [Nitrososphaerales archaeon]
MYPMYAVMDRSYELLEFEAKQIKCIDSESRKDTVIIAYSHVVKRT